MSEVIENRLAPRINIAPPPKQSPNIPVGGGASPQAGPNNFNEMGPADLTRPFQDVPGQYDDDSTWDIPDSRGLANASDSSNIQLLPGETSEQFFNRINTIGGGRIGPSPVGPPQMLGPPTQGGQQTGQLQQTIYDENPAPPLPPPESTVTLKGNADSFDPNTPGGISGLFQPQPLPGPDPRDDPRLKDIDKRIAKEGLDSQGNPIFNRSGWVTSGNTPSQGLADEVRAGRTLTGAEMMNLGQSQDQFLADFPMKLQDQHWDTGRPTYQNEEIAIESGGQPQPYLEPRIKRTQQPPPPPIYDPGDRGQWSPPVSPPGPSVDGGIGGAATPPGGQINLAPPPTLAEAAQGNVPEDPRLTGLVNQFTQGIVSPEQRRIMESQLVSQVQEGSAARRADLADRLGGAGVFGGAARSELGRVFGESERGLATGLAGIQSNILNKNIEGQTQALETMFGLQGMNSQEAREAARLATQTNLSQGQLDLGTSRLGLDAELGRGSLDLSRDKFGLDAELGRGALDLNRDRFGLEAELGRGQLKLNRIKTNLNNQIQQGRLDLDTAALDFSTALRQETNAIKREEMMQDFTQFLIEMYATVDEASKQRIELLLRRLT